MLKPPITVKHLFIFVCLLLTTNANYNFRYSYFYDETQFTEVSLNISQVLPVLTHVEINTTLSVDGTVYCLAQIPSVEEPSATSLKNAGSRLSVKNGIPSIIQFIDLKENTNYDVYCYAEGVDGTSMKETIQSTKHQIKTQNDLFAPFMMIDTLQATTNTILIDVVASDEGSINCYYTSSSTIIPSYSEVLRSSYYSNVTNPFEEISIILSGLSSSTTYYVYCVFQDTQGHFMKTPLQSSMKSITTESEGTSAGILALQVIICVVLVAMSGMFSGLNLALMGLDLNSLKMIAESDVTEIAGTDMNDEEVQEMIKQKKYAQRIEPIRKTGNLLLVSQLVGNVMVNSLISILSADFTSGLWGFILSTVFITTFGEIVPQAYISRHGLEFGAKTIWYTRTVMTLLWIICKPISMILDCCLGEEIGDVYNRWQLYTMFELYKGKSKYGEETISTMQGALSLDTSTIGSACTPLDKVYMLPISQILDQNTCLDIFTKGFSRVPIYKDTRENIVGILYVKDLILIDPHEKVPVSTLLQLFKRPIIHLDSETTHAKALKQMASQYIQICVVTEVVEVFHRDNDIHVKGIVTLEDVIEDVLKMDINDETDAPAMNDIAHTTTQIEKFFDSMQIANIDESLLIILETFLHNAIRYNGYEIDSEIVVQLIKNSEIKKIPVNGDPLFTYNQPTDTCIMLLEGLVECEIGKERILSEKSRFSVFSFPALIEDNYVSEMTVYAKEILITDFITQKPSGYVNEALVLIIHKSVADFLNLKDHLSPFTDDFIQLAGQNSMRYFNKNIRRQRTNKSLSVFSNNSNSLLD